MIRLTLFAALSLGTASPALAREPDLQARIVAALTGANAPILVTAPAGRDPRPLQDRIVASVTGADLTYRPSDAPPVAAQDAITRALR